MTVSWLFLAAAIVFEVAGTTSMKLSEGFTRPVPSVALFILYAISFTMLTLALKKIDVSVAYTVWSGIGTTVIALIGWQLFGEQLTPFKIACIGLVIAGVIGLTVGGSSHG
ncbi:DMT family transporter [Novispirillum itersonii]|uniref:Small multidrug resistance pump n=1 Tax=Novispirillum itersonii TaxID=189 RepID=A0A7W9ZH88_NOVIT|nr:multidrug efflux SMR transporter [Novispirillum itersonii]MBB6211432.1 small multidrug resistance pump [Novispirillum itersonii]